MVFLFLISSSKIIILTLGVSSCIFVVKILILIFEDGEDFADAQNLVFYAVNLDVGSAIFSE